MVAIREVLVMHFKSIKWPLPPVNHLGILKHQQVHVFALDLLTGSFFVPWSRVLCMLNQGRQLALDDLFLFWPLLRVFWKQFACSCFLIIFRFFRQNVKRRVLLFVQRMPVQCHFSGQTWSTFAKWRSFHGTGCHKYSKCWIGEFSHFKMTHAEEYVFFDKQIISRL